MLSELINFLYPPRCAACGELIPRAGSQRVCARCLGRIERLTGPLCAVCGVPSGEPADAQGRCPRCRTAPPAFRRARAVARYRPADDDGRGTLGAIIRRHKYGLDQSLGKALAQCLGERLPIMAEDYDLIVPVPLHARRLRWRGFNQSALLAAELARRLGKPLDATCLKRVRATTPQTMRTHVERLRNVRRAFAVRHPARTKGQRILVIDDVMTTGATVDECARVLLAAGARVVDVFTLARVLP